MKHILSERDVSLHRVVQCWFLVVFYLFCYWTSILISLLLFPLFPSTLSHPAFVAAWGECVDGAAQRGRFHSLSRGGGAGERRRLASSAAGYQQSGGSSEPAQSSLVFRSGALPGELLYPSYFKSPSVYSCSFVVIKVCVLHVFRLVWRWMGSCGTPSWRLWALVVWRGLMAKFSMASVAVYRSVLTIASIHIRFNENVFWCKNKKRWWL